jgi:hypothetical protein
MEADVAEGVMETWVHVTCRRWALKSGTPRVGKSCVPHGRFCISHITLKTFEVYRW